MCDDEYRNEMDIEDANVKRTKKQKISWISLLLSCSWSENLCDGGGFWWHLMLVVICKCSQVLIQVHASYYKVDLSMDSLLWHVIYLCVKYL